MKNFLGEKKKLRITWLRKYTYTLTNTLLKVLLLVIQHCVFGANNITCPLSDLFIPVFLATMLQINQIGTGFPVDSPQVISHVFNGI